MFEDATFESAGAIHTRSRSWMVATFALNTSILLALILIPLLYPQALPWHAMTMLMEAPPPPPEPKPQPRTESATPMQSQIQDGSIQAPSPIPRPIFIPSEPETEISRNAADFGGSGLPVDSSTFGGPAKIAVAPQGPTRVSTGVMTGLLIEKTVPTYPPIPKALHMEGTVELQATISRTGTIENLRAVSGPQMLQQAALDAVKNWRYRPYLLNGAPVEVETTINVVFRLQ